MKGTNGLAFEYATTSDQKILNIDKLLRKL
jgi:hypothetical protein